MTTNTNQPWREWLDAESASREDLAEQAFARLMADLPGEEPSVAFMERVAASAWQRQSRRRRLTWAARAAAVVSVVAGGAVGLAVVGPAVMARAGAGAIEVARGVTWIAEMAATGLRLWSFLGNVGSAVGAVVATPQSTSVLVGLALTGALAMFGMQRLLLDEPAQKEARA